MSREWGYEGWPRRPLLNLPDDGPQNIEVGKIVIEKNIRDKFTQPPLHPFSLGPNGSRLPLVPSTFYTDLISPLRWVVPKNPTKDLGLKRISGHEEQGTDWSIISTARNYDSVDAFTRNGYLSMVAPGTGVVSQASEFPKHKKVPLPQRKLEGLKNYRKLDF